MLELIVRLKQICNPDLNTGVSSKLENISERFYTLTELGYKALIFSQYKSQFYGVEAAAKYLRNFNPLTLTGDIPPDLRLEVANQFKASKTHKALILSLKVGRVGLNLQEASYVFHLDRWWNPAEKKQALFDDLIDDVSLDLSTKLNRKELLALFGLD